MLARIRSHSTRHTLRREDARNRRAVGGIASRSGESIEGGEIGEAADEGGGAGGDGTET